MLRIIFAIITMFCAAQMAFAASVTAITVEAMPAETRLVIHGEGFSSADVKIFEIKEGKRRIVIDIQGATSKLLHKGMYKGEGDGVVAALRGAIRGRNDLRFVSDIKDGSKFAGKSITPEQITVKIKGRSTSKPITVSTSSDISADVAGIPVPRLKPRTKIKPVIAIDAGHGGRDPGAIGGTGLQEKDITLKAALELKRQLLATGRYKVVLSRGDDRYIEHDDRLRVARARNADLFISIHADATVGTSARGASVYTLADRAKNRSKRIVNSQNWIMDVKLSEQSDPVGDILVDLAQRSTLSKSTEFADILIKKLGGSSHLLRNTHRRAGYYVLLAPDVPAVLLEMGFISNPQDEKLLKSAKHRKKVMSSVVSAINSYFARQKS